MIIRNEDRYTLLGTALCIFFLFAIPLIENRQASDSYLMYLFIDSFTSFYTILFTSIPIVIFLFRRHQSTKLSVINNFVALISLFIVGSYYFMSRVILSFGVGWLFYEIQKINLLITKEVFLSFFALLDILYWYISTKFVLIEEKHTVFKFTYLTTFEALGIIIITLVMITLLNFF